MTILVINPNSAAPMTTKIGVCARSAAAPGTEVIAVNPPDGPPSIEGYSDGAMAIAGCLSGIRDRAGRRYLRSQHGCCLDDLDEVLSRHHIVTFHSDYRRIGREIWHASEM